MKQETKNGIRGLIAFVAIVVGMIFMLELGWLEFLRNPNDENFKMYSAKKFGVNVRKVIRKLGEEFKFRKYNLHR